MSLSSADCSPSLQAFSSLVPSWVACLTGPIIEKKPIELLRLGRFEWFVHSFGTTACQPIRGLPRDSRTSKQAQDSKTRRGCANPSDEQLAILFLGIFERLRGHCFGITCTDRAINHRRIQ